MFWNSTSSGDLFPGFNESVVDFFDDYVEGNFSEYDLELHQILREPREENFRHVISILVVSASVLGLIVNLFILVISVWHIRGDYRLFIANLAAVDIVCALLYGFLGFVNLTQGDYHQISSAIMTYSAFAFYGSFGVLIFALVPVSISRIVAASQPKVYNQVK